MMKSIVNAIHDWWTGVRRFDVSALRYGDSCDTEIRIRCGPWGLVLYAVMEKYGEKWDTFWSDLRHLVDECSDGGRARVPIVRIAFG